MAGLSLRWVRGLPTHDATNAFKIYDRAMVKSFEIESRGGFELNLELTVKAFLAGYRITEVPGVIVVKASPGFVSGNGYPRTCAGTCMRFAVSRPRLGSG